jgi:putative ABC transport system permease protein
VIRQMGFMQRSKLNHAGSQLLSIRYGGTAPQGKFEAFRQAVLQNKDVEFVTMANHLPRLEYFGYIGAEVKFPEFEDKDLNWKQLNVDYYFAKTYSLEFTAGRDFEAGNPSDSTSIILNEAAIRALNQPIEKVIGATVLGRYYNPAIQGPDTRSMKVIGVIKDFPYESMHRAIEPLILTPRVHFIDRIAYVKLRPGNFQQTIAAVEQNWKDIFPGLGFDYWFVSDEFARMYLAETRVASLAKYFAVLAILITVLGVFGLASYTAEQKTKEVGIRKVLGANITQVVGMFIWLFLKVFIIASVVALPVAYFLANYWLEGFVYRSELSLQIFLFSLSGLLFVTLVTVSYETWKAASVNPVHSLRSE